MTDDQAEDDALLEDIFRDNTFSGAAWEATRSADKTGSVSAHEKAARYHRDAEIMCWRKGDRNRAADHGKQASIHSSSL